MNSLIKRRASKKQTPASNRTHSAVHRLPTHEQITKRAYEIFLERGSQPGREVDDWLQAEYELMQLPVRKIAELGPTGRKNGIRSALVCLVQAALVLGASSLTQLRR
jgi:hypothetical protein